MLVNDPKTFAIHSHDETGAHLTERFQIGNLSGARQRRRGVTLRPSEVFRPVGNGFQLSTNDSHFVCSGISKRTAGLKGKALRNRLQRRAGQIESSPSSVVRNSSRVDF